MNESLSAKEALDAAICTAKDWWLLEQIRLAGGSVKEGNNPRPSDISYLARALGIDTSNRTFAKDPRAKELIATERLGGKLSAKEWYLLGQIVTSGGRVNSYRSPFASDIVCSAQVMGIDTSNRAVEEKIRTAVEAQKKEVDRKKAFAQIRAEGLEELKRKIALQYQQSPDKGIQAAETPKSRFNLGSNPFPAEADEARRAAFVRFQEEIESNPDLLKSTAAQTVMKALKPEVNGNR